MATSHHHHITSLHSYPSFSVNVVTAYSDPLPLNEVDFSNCHGCTPSYRELPPCYPPLHCSARGKLEQSVLNDTWVSMPVGSEGTEQYKQMERNPTEVRLLEFEEERYEVRWCLLIYMYVYI